MKSPVMVLLSAILGAGPVSTAHAQTTPPPSPTEAVGYHLAGRCSIST